MGQHGGDDRTKRKAEGAAATREQRLATALRANLLKRKAQARARDASARPRRRAGEPAK
jgi:hypothetical protein